MDKKHTVGRSRSIFTRLFFPLMGVFFFQVLVTVLIIANLNIEKPESLKKILIISIIISATLFLFVAYVLSRHLSYVLKRVLGDIQSSSNTTSIRLDKVNIREIDGLIDAIEKNSEALFSQARRVSRIVTYANPHLGVFEDDEKFPSVYCSLNFFKIFKMSRNALGSK